MNTENIVIAKFNNNTILRRYSNSYRHLLLYCIVLNLKYDLQHLLDLRLKMNTIMTVLQDELVRHPAETINVRDQFYYGK